MYTRIRPYVCIVTLKSYKHVHRERHWVSSHIVYRLTLPLNIRTKRYRHLQIYMHMFTRTRHHIRATSIHLVTDLEPLFTWLTFYHCLCINEQTDTDTHTSTSIRCHKRSTSIINGCIHAYVHMYALSHTSYKQVFRERLCKHAYVQM